MRRSAISATTALARADGVAADTAVSVTAVNDARSPSPDSYSVAEDGTLTVTVPGVLGNDTDVDSPTLSAVLVDGRPTGPDSQPDGSLTYTPVANYFGRRFHLPGE